VGKKEIDANMLQFVDDTLFLGQVKLKIL